MEKEMMMRRINEALATLYKVDAELIKNRTNEETIVTHLVGHLRPVFRSDDWDVDAGYNRDGSIPKEDSRGNRIRPDVIIHHRTSDRTERVSPANNLVAMEVKGYWNREDRNNDEQKLRDVGRRYGYRYLFRVELKKEVGELIEVR